MIPISFILNFQVSSAKATQSIKGMTSATEGLAQSFEQVSANFNDWYGKNIDVLNLTKMQLRSVGDELNQAFNVELAKDFGKGIHNVSEEYQNMYKDKEFKRLEGSFDSLLMATKKIVPYLRMGDSSLQNMLNSLTTIRVSDGAQSIEELNKTMEKLGKTFDGMNPKQHESLRKLFEEFGKSPKYEKDIKKLEQGVKGIVAQKEGLDQLKNAFTTLFAFPPTLDGLIQKVAQLTGAYTAFQDAMSAQKEMVKTITQLGMTTTNLKSDWLAMAKPVNNMSESVLRLGSTTQSSMLEAAEAMGALANQRVTTNIADMEELGKTSIRMTQAFGMSTDQATEFIKSLYKIGGLSKNEVAGAADVMANVQHQLGLTSSEASGVATQVGNMTRTMKVFGGRVKDINAMTKGVAKLNVAFSKAGLSADEANQMLTKMLDPASLEENILLFQGLGMSAQDAIGMMTGDTSKLANMDERMVQLAKNLKAQYGGNVFALKEMAAQYGMTLEQVQSLSQLTAKDMAMKKESADLEEQANKARASMLGELQKLWNQLNVLMQAFVMPIVNTLTPILGVVVKAFQSISEWVNALRKDSPVFDLIARAFSFIAGGAVLAGLLGIGAGFMSMLHPIKLITGGIGKFGELLSGAVKGAKNLIANMKNLGKIRSPVGDVAKSGGVPKASGKAPDMKGVEKGGGFIDKASKIKPAQLLAVGAAIFFIAAGIALIVASVALLATTMKGLNLEQINGLIAIMAIVMGGMIGIMIVFAITLSVLGAAGLAAAPGIIAVGVAMLLMGAGVALIVASVALLISVISNSANGIAAFGAVVTQILPLFVGLAAGIMAVGMAMVMLGTFAAVGIAGLLMLAGIGIVLALMIPVVTGLGNAFASMGSGIKNVAEFGLAAANNLIALRDVISSIGSGFAENFTAQINAMADSLSKLSGQSILITAGLKMMGAIAPSTNANGPETANTDRVASLISESNTYLSAIMDNTDKIVKILSREKPEPQKSGTTQKNYTAPIMAK